MSSRRGAFWKKALYSCKNRSRPACWRTKFEKCWTAASRLNNSPRHSPAQLLSFEPSFFFGQVNRFPRSRGLASSVENLGDDDIRLQGRWTFGLHAVEKDGPQVRDGIILRRWQRLGFPQLFFSFG